jgi:hypothetical protein
MIDEADVEERLRRTYTVVAASTTLAERILPSVADESNGSPRRPRRPRARLLVSTAAVLCAFLLAGFVFVGPSDHPHPLVEVTPTTSVPGSSTATGLSRLALPGGYTGYVPEFGPIAITPDGTTAYVGASQSGVVTPIDLRRGRAQRPIAVGEFPVAAIAITPNGRTAYVVEGGVADTVVPVDLTTGTAGPAIHSAGTTALGSSIAITPDGHTAYVSSLSQNKVLSTFQGSETTTEAVPGFVVPIDLTTNTARRPIALTPLPGGGTVPSEATTCVGNCGFNDTIGGIAITPDGRTAYVSATVAQMNGVFPIDLRTGRAGPEIHDGEVAGPIVIAPDGLTVYVGGLGTVTPIDLASNRARPAIQVTPGVPFSAMTIIPDGNTLVTVRYRSIDVINTHSGTVESPITNPSGGSRIAIVPDATSPVPRSS